MNERIADMSAADVVILLGGLFLLGVACFYAMLFIFATLTGWRALAKRYRDVEHEATPLLAGSTTIGSHSWSSPPLWAGVDAKGLTLRPARPFRPIFPSLFIPWTQIVRAERRNRMFFEVLELYCGTPGKEVIVGFLPSGAAEAIEARLPVKIAEAN